MLDTFRRFIRSKLGVVITLGVLAMIALAFAAGSVAGSDSFGGVAGGDRAAIVGGERIGTADVTKQVRQGYTLAREQTPGLTMKAFLAGGGLEEALGQLIDRTAIAAFGKAHGIVAGKRLVDSELAKIPALQGPDGRFSESAYRTLLASRQLTDADVRADITGGLVAKQVLLPAEFGATLPAPAVMTYAALLKEHRTGAGAVLPAMLFAPKTPPSEAEIAAYYAANKAAFTLPERRVLRVAVFGADALKAVAAPAEADIAARYTANAAQYAASETRTIIQLIVPGEAEAKDMLAAAARSGGAGGGLAAAAHAKGLSTAAIGPLTREALAQQASPEVAAAVFAAHAGSIVGPVKGPLGWTIAHIDTVTDKPARSLAQVHDEIATALLAERRRAALGEATARIDDGFGKGEALADAARSLGLTPALTPPLTADGHVFGTAATAPPQLARIIPAAFQMEREGAPQLAEIEPGKTFAMFDVTQIVPAAPAPLAQVRNVIITAIAIDKGAVRAQDAGKIVLKEIRHGKDLATALHDVSAALGVQLPPVQPLDMGRDDLSKFQGHIPPVLSLFFGMAQGTAKLIPMDGNRGWSIVQVTAIQPGSLAANDPLIADTGRELANLAGNEYAEELRNAVRADVGVKRNETAIRATSAQLAGN